MTREEFLEEVQYLAQMPDRLNMLSADTNERIADALALHPWVARVERIEQKPGEPVRALIEYRVPVLAVTRPARVVDRDGVVLPLSAPRGGLPILEQALLSKPGKPGQPWADARLKAAARVAHLLRPHLEALGLMGCAVEVRKGEVTLHSARRVVRWGRSPGQEKAGEPTAKEKLDRLLGQTQKTDEELDLRK
jgi:hypothetical protein